ncbi:taste receptor type 2 member 123-like [Bufo gargarizans]|uniref:taste receptor type 2 member 123-like n=1 Tax=Bufo gargarizans TaxID=30331 RepID=UPI001CF3A269|nr:taste receptor type 2 member 123-like [Bufo gargarizans]
MLTQNPLFLLYIVILSVETIYGVSTNAFIIFFICYYYGLDKSASNKVILALSIANVLYASISYINVMLVYIKPIIFQNTSITPTVFVFGMFLITSSSWLTVCLCVFYFMKIQTFRSDFLSRLKTKVSSAIPWMILMAELLSAVSASFNILEFLENGDSAKNLSLVQLDMVKASSTGIFPNNLYISFVSSCLPFLISVVTTGATIWSLKKHSNKMEKSHTKSSAGVNVKAYERTIRHMMRLLIFYGIFYVILFLFYFNLFPAFTTGFWVFLMVTFLYAPVQSTLLIFANTKLKKAWMKIFHCKVTSSQEEESGSG